MNNTIHLNIIILIKTLPMHSRILNGNRPLFLAINKPKPLTRQAIKLSQFTSTILPAIWFTQAMLAKHGIIHPENT